MIRGILTPAITALDADRNLDYQKNEKHLNYLIENEIDGILSLGTIGEFFSFTKEEKKKYISFVINTVQERVPVLIGTGGTVVEDVIELTQFAEKEGAAGACIITPYYFQFDDETLYNFYSQIATNTDLPIYIYNFPARSGVNISPDLVLHLAQDHDNISGIKDTVDSISHTRELITKVKKELERDFAVYSGYDEYLIPNLLAGGDGVVGGLTNLVPGLFVELFQAYYNQNLNKISSLSKKITILMEIYNVSSPFFPSIKQAVSILGANINPICKQPIKELSSKQIKEIKTLIKQAEVN